MNRRPASRRQYLRTVATLVAGVALSVAATAAAQGLPTEPLRVGIVLPPATGDPLTDAVATSAAGVLLGSLTIAWLRALGAVGMRLSSDGSHARSRQARPKPVAFITDNRPMTRTRSD